MTYVYNRDCSSVLALEDFFLALDAHDVSLAELPVAFRPAAIASRLRLLLIGQVELVSLFAPDGSEGSRVLSV